MLLVGAQRVRAAGIAVLEDRPRAGRLRGSLVAEIAMIGLAVVSERIVEWLIFGHHK
jgi:hypothetical protein